MPTPAAHTLHFRSSRWFAVAALLSACVATRVHAQLASGNLVVEQVGTTGNGTALSSAASPVYLNQYNPAGTLQNTVALPNADSGTTHALTDTGTGTSDGYFTRSSNGLLLSLPGYDAATGTASVASASGIARTVGLINGAGTTDTSRTYTFLSGNNFRSLVSPDGASFYAGGAGGIVYTNATSGAGTALLTGNTRNVNLFNGNLFASTSSATFNGTGSSLGIYQIGSGLPTAAPGTAGIVNIINTGTGSSPYAYQFNTAMTVAYVADDRASASGGIQKWTLSNGTWSLAYTLSTGVASIGARGVTVDWSNPAAPVIYGTSAEGSADRLFTVTDAGSTSAAKTLATATTNTIFRGVDLALLPSVWTNSTGTGNWASTDTTTYNATLGAVAVPYDNWSTALVNDDNLAFQNLAVATSALNNNTALTSVSSLNFTGGGTIANAQTTAYTLSGNALTLSGTAATSAAGTFTTNASTYVAVVANNSTATQTVNIPLTLGAANQAFRAVNGPLVFGGTINNGGNTLGVAGANNATFNAAINGAGGLTKVEAGTALLTTGSSYLGATTVVAGGLAISNPSGTSATGNGAVTVGAGGTLLGTGYINAGANPVTVNGTLAPATVGTTGTINVASTAAVGALTLSNTATLAFDITSTTVKDLVSLGGSSLALGGGTLALTLPSTGGTGIDYTATYTLFSGISSFSLTNSATAGFATVTGYDTADYSAQLNYNGTSGTYDLSFAPVPEPGTVLGGLLLVGAAGWKGRRRVRAVWMSLRRVPCTA